MESVFALLGGVLLACSAPRQSPTSVIASPPTSATVPVQIAASTPTVEPPATTTPVPASASAAALPIGAPLAADRSSDVDMADVLAEPDRYQGKPLTVRGVVTAVCQARGCWLELAPEGAQPGASAARGCRVVSEHHDWFVPHDAAGSIARVQGRLEIRTISAAQVEHMESEGGRFETKLPDGTARELRVVASGVELARK